MCKSPDLARLENRPLVLDLVEWVMKRPRSYAEVMEAWRTSCPRLPIWEDAVEHRLIVLERRAGVGDVVSVTSAGVEFLRSNGRA